MDALKPVLMAAFLGFIASVSYGMALNTLNLPTSLNETMGHDTTNPSSFNN